MQYSSFIRYIQWGDRYAPIYIRYGKLTGITLGDGALVNGFFDQDVGTHSTRPGLNVTLDGMLVRVPNAGFEYVTNDLFNPTLLAWRVYARPFSLQYPLSFFANTELGVSYAENPSATFTDREDPHTRKLIASIWHPCFSVLDGILCDSDQSPGSFISCRACTVGNFGSQASFFSTPA